MKHGFVKVAVVTPKIKVADTTYNGEVIRELMQEAAQSGAKVAVFPELCVTGASCGDLFFQSTLIAGAKEELYRLVVASQDCDTLYCVGLPMRIGTKLYNVAAVFARGVLLGIVPKSYVKDTRYFASGKDLNTDICWEEDESVSVATDLIFEDTSNADIKIAVEIGEDLLAPQAPSVSHALSGATIMLNLSATEATAGARVNRRVMMVEQSKRLLCAYLCANAGEGESTQDMVYSGHNLIVENGEVLAESNALSHGIVYAELDVERLAIDRRKDVLFEVEDTHIEIPFELDPCDITLTRIVDDAPFVPKDEAQRRVQCEEIFDIQVMGLKKRMEHTNAATAVIGISGGLDSTLALLVTARTFEVLGKDKKDIIAVTMPGFGTTDRTYDNAVSMIKHLGATFMEVDIKAAVRQHFADIGHDENVHDVTYENSQARERTQILMDIANRKNGLVIGTGDMSELALGWATYNGDHMSNYGVNASVPKTLVRHLVAYYADSCKGTVLSDVLYDVLDTPVSPELLPPENGKIAQKTEDLVGPYELHDFFMYYVLRYGFLPEKILRLAKAAFGNRYSYLELRKWLQNFYRRFFTQQFKRSCLPDGPKVFDLSVSPRGALCMPSDASFRIWLDSFLD